MKYWVPGWPLMNLITQPWGMMEGFVNYRHVEFLLQKSIFGEYSHVGHNHKEEDVQKIG
jgi:hypothetical protein